MKWLRHWLDGGSRAIEDVLARDPRTGRFCYDDRLTIADIYLIISLDQLRALLISEAELGERIMRAARGAALCFSMAPGHEELRRAR
jgi:glutathione S-transferase